MKIEFRELISNGYTLRGLFSKPESEYKDLVVMLHGFTGHKNENGYLFKQLTQTLTDNQIILWVVEKVMEILKILPFLRN